MRGGEMCEYTPNFNISEGGGRPSTPPPPTRAEGEGRARLDTHTRKQSLLETHKTLPQNFVAVESGQILKRGRASEAVHVTGANALGVRVAIRRPPRVSWRARAPSHSPGSPADVPTARQHNFGTAPRGSHRSPCLEKKLEGETTR
jgi:hypothetical protein